MARLAICVFLISIVFPLPTVGQRMTGGGGVGWAHSSSSTFTSGPAMQLFGEASLKSWISGRISVGTILGRTKYFGILPDEDPAVAEPRDVDLGLEPLLWGSLAAVLSRNNVYAMAGMAYHYQAHWQRGHPWEQGLGITAGAGVRNRLAGHPTYVELGFHLTGNTFYDLAETVTLVPLMAGLRF